MRLSQLPLPGLLLRSHRCVCVCDFPRCRSTRLYGFQWLQGGARAYSTSRVRQALGTGSPDRVQQALRDAERRKQEAEAAAVRAKKEQAELAKKLPPRSRATVMVPATSGKVRRAAPSSSAGMDAAGFNPVEARRMAIMADMQQLLEAPDTPENRERARVLLEQADAFVGDGFDAQPAPKSAARPSAPASSKAPPASTASAGRASGSRRQPVRKPSSAVTPVGSMPGAGGPDEEMSDEMFAKLCAEAGLDPNNPDLEYAGCWMWAGAVGVCVCVMPLRLLPTVQPSAQADGTGWI